MELRLMCKESRAFVAGITWFLLDLIFTYFFITDVLPFFNPLMLKGEWWLFWPTITLLGGPWTFLVAYAVLRSTNHNFNFVEWQWALFAYVLLSVTTTTTALALDRVLSFDFEPYRSTVIPLGIFTAIYVVIARFKYSQKANLPL
jgi:hypothetical protein